MSDASAQLRGTPATHALLSRLIGVIFSPRDTFTEVAAAPRWLGMLALVTLVAAGCTGWFLSTEIGRQALLDEQVARMESFGMQVSQEAYSQLQKTLPFSAYLGAGQILVTVPLMTLIVAGLLFAVFNAGLGGDASFRQVFAVVAHAGAVSVVQQLFVTPLNYVRESMSSATSLMAFLPMLDESSVAARFLGTIDLFIVWWTVVLAIGMAVLYRRKTRSILLSFFGVYAVIALTVALVLRALGGS